MFWLRVWPQISFRWRNPQLIQCKSVLAKMASKAVNRFKKGAQMWQTTDHTTEKMLATDRFVCTRATSPPPQKKFTKPSVECLLQYALSGCCLAFSCDELWARCGKEEHFDPDRSSWVYQLLLFGEQWTTEEELSSLSSYYEEERTSLLRSTASPGNSQTNTANTVVKK